MRNNYIFLSGFFKSRTKGRIEEYFCAKTKTLLTLLIVLTGIINVNGQTIIDPTGSGGFESGTVFGSDPSTGWVAVNSSVNKWVIGANSTPNSGGSAAYISNDNGASNTYTINTTSNVYSWMYRDITIPAGQTKITVSYNYKSGGAGGDLKDKILVFFAPTSVVPKADEIPLTSTFVEPNGSTFGFGQAAYTQISNVVPSYLTPSGGTFRLIIGWQNNIGSGVQSPASIDDISVVASSPASYTSVAGGTLASPSLWSNPATWNPAGVPAVGDNVIIAAGTFVTVDAANTTIGNVEVNGTLLQTNALTCTGNLTVGDDGNGNKGLFVLGSATGQTCSVAGNITNNGTINASLTSATLTLNGWNTQTVNGSGNFHNASAVVANGSNTPNIYNLTFSNFAITDPTVITPNIVWSIDGITVTNTLRFEPALINRVNLGTKKMTLGTSASSGTLTMATSINYGISSGFLTGGKFSRFYLAAGTGSGTFSAGVDPSSTGGRYPFVTAGGSDRSFYLGRTGSPAAGQIAVTYTDATNISTVNLAESVTRELDAKWTVSTEGTTPTSASVSVGLMGKNGFYMANGNARVIHDNGAGMLGQHQTGTNTPGAQRTGIAATPTVANLTGDYYLGYNSVADSAVYSKVSGDWNVASTWSTDPFLPSSTDTVVIKAGTNVTVKGTGNVAKSLTIAGNASLTMSTSSTDLTIGSLRNSSLINNGTLAMSNGTLNINGNFLSTPFSTFVQSNGDIVINGNDGSANSVAASTSLCDIQCTATAGSFSPTNLSLTGGTITIVNPHKGTNVNNDFSLSITGNGTILSAAGKGHTVIFGDGTSTVSGGSINGFHFLTSNYLLGSVKVNSTATGTNRRVTPRTNTEFGIAGDLNIRPGGDFFATSGFFIAGDLINNGAATFQADLGLGISYGSGSRLPSPNAQTISGSGVFQTSMLDSILLNSIYGLNINNGSAEGVTLQTPLSYLNSVSYTNGVLHTDDTNYLTAGNFAAGIVKEDQPAFKANSYIDGPFGRVIYAGTNAAAGNAKYYAFPSGKLSGGTFINAPIWISPTVTATTVIKVKFENTNGGTMSSSITNLSTSTKWNVVSTVPGAITNMNVRLGYDGLPNAVKIPVSSDTVNGTYTNSFGDSSIWTDLTAATASFIGYPPSIQSTGAGAYKQFISFADARTCTTPAPGATIASASTFCTGKKIDLSLTNATAGSGVTYQWQSSVNNVTYTDIVGATKTTYSAFPTITTYYRCKVTCATGSTTVASTGVMVTGTNTTLGTTSVSRCGAGTVSLAATTGGSAVKWYTSPTPQANNADYVGTGNPITSPSINTTTTYYVTSENDSGTGDFTMPNVEHPATYVSIGVGAMGQIFSSADAATIKSVDFYPGFVLSYVFQLCNTTVGTTKGTVLATYTKNITQAERYSGMPITVTFPPEFNVPAGANNYMLTMAGSARRVEVTPGSYSYPYITNGFSINGHISEGTTVTNSKYMSLFNWKINSRITCATSRTPLVATVINPSVLDPLTTPRICKQANATASIAVSGDISPLATYVWESKEGAGAWTAISSNNPNYSGSTTSKLTITRTLDNVPATGTLYRVKVTTTCFTPVLSTEVALQEDTVLAQVTTITTATTFSPENTVCKGSSVDFELAAGSKGNIEWQSGPSATGPWTTVQEDPKTAATNLSLLFTSSILTADTWFRVVATDGACSAASTTPLKITVSQTPLAGSILGAATVCPYVAPVTQTTTLHLFANSFNRDDVISWYSSTVDPDGGSPEWEVINGATTISYDAMNLTVTTWYKARITNGACGFDETVTPVKMTVKPVYSFYQDNDHDGYGAGSLVENICAVDANTPPVGYSTNNGDCNDGDNTKKGGAFTLQPQSTSMCTGNTATLTAAVSGTGLTSKWQKQVGTAWANVTTGATGMNSQSLTLTATPANLTKYRLMVTGGACGTLISDVATVTVTTTGVPAAITPVWGKQTGACIGTMLTLTCAAGKTKGNVQMEYAYFDGNVAPAIDSSEWKPLGSVQSGSLTATNGAITRTITPDAGKIWFRTVASFAGSCGGTVYSAAAGLAVNSGVTAGNADVSYNGSHNGVVCAGVTFRLSLPSADLTGGARTVGTVVTTWYKSTSYTGSIATTKWTAAGVGTGADCHLDVPALATTWYYANIVNGSCNSQSNVVNVTVTPTALAGKIVAGKTVCKNDNITLTASPIKRTGNHFKWEVSTDQAAWFEIGGDADFVTVGGTYTATAGSTFYVRYTISSTDGVNGLCSSSVSSAAAVKVDFPTVSGSAFGGGLVCANSPVPLAQGKLTVKGNTGKYFQWQYSTAGESTGFVNVPASLGGLPFTSSSAKSTTNSYIVTTVTQDIWFRAVVANGACGSETTGAVKFDTGERPELTQIGSSVASGNVCAGVSAYLTADGFVGSGIKWQLSINGGSFADIALATKTAYTTPKLANTTATPISMTYKAIALIGDCDFVAKTITFTVYPTAKATAVTGNLLTGTRDGSTALKAICLGGSNALGKILTLTSGYVGTIEWQTLVNGSYVACAGIANQQNYTVSAPVTGLNTFRVKLVSGPCTVMYTSPFKVYYDATCSTARTMVEETAVTPFAITAYPNPYSETFRLNVATTSDARVGFMVYDMTGRLLDQREATPSEISTMTFGDRYPAGIYNVIVTQGTEVETLRMVKR